MTERRVVCFGSSRVQEGTAGFELAESVGKAIGTRGLTLVSGGYQGAMGAVSRGAKQAGGRVVGITTQVFADRVGNVYLDEERVEPDYPTRLAALLKAGDAFVALPGGLGTLSEWITAWCLATIDQLGGPLWVFRDPWGPLGESSLRLTEVAGQHEAHVNWVVELGDLERGLDRWLDASGR